MKRHGNWRVGTGKWVGILGLLLFMLNAFSAFNAAAEDEYNFSWLDPDKKIYVLQNRKYQKAGKVLLSAMVGPGWSNPYRDTFNIDPRLAFYFSENWGIEAFYTVIRNSENTTYTALKKTAATTIPVVREVTAQYGALVHWAPWYAKINFFNWILYFDWYLEGGFGNVNTQVDLNTAAAGKPNFQQQNKFAVFVGTGHQFHLSHHFVARLDVMGAYYNAQPLGNTGDSEWFSNYNFTFGIGFRP